MVIAATNKMLKINIEGEEMQVSQLKYMDSIMGSSGKHNREVNERIG